MCCGQGRDTSKFHMSLIHKHADSYDILMFVDKGETTLNSIYHSYTNIHTVMDILMCCGQGGDDIPYITHTQTADSYGYNALWTRERHL